MESPDSFLGAGSTRALRLRGAGGSCLWQSRDRDRERERGAPAFGSRGEWADFFHGESSRFALGTMALSLARPLARGLLPTLRGGALRAKSHFVCDLPR